MESYIFPSVIESNNYEIKNVASDLLHGMKFYEDDLGYIIGYLALSEGISPNKTINSYPEELDYRLLSKAGMLIAHMNNPMPKYLVTGFPYSIFHVNKRKAEDILSGQHQITYDPAPFDNEGLPQMITTKVAHAEVIPEIEACSIAARKGDLKMDGNFFMVSIGYGTFEAVLSTPKGLVYRTIASLAGLRYAINLAIKEIAKTFYLGLRSEQQFDVAFREGSIILNRQRLDISEIRRRSLQRYYRDVISPVLRNVWKDDDFKATRNMILTGGGALYKDLVDCFVDDFEILNVQTVDDPLKFASKGYCIKALENASGDKDAALGLDIGNSTTVVTLYPTSINEVGNQEPVQNYAP
ncbi:MAG: ParM/StbA family protein [Melioribacteraceae bacterium]|nr:ParM/StbA family protein [Melioribacteraceae bacterium]